jgi:hypothetical protein
MLDNGSVLYQDIWDVKQPGIFVFYWFGGRLFGFSEAGAHLLELIYLGSFAVLATKVLRTRYETQWVAGLIPVATVGWYYAVAQLNYLTQVESLVGPLLFASSWLLWRGGSGRSFWAGVFGVVALYLKLALAPLLLLLWLGALHESGGIRQGAARVLAPLAAGVSVAAVPFVAFVLTQGLVDRVWWTFITYPPEVIPIAGRNLRRLVLSVGQFGVLLLPLFLLAVHGIWLRRDDSLTRIWILWVIGGLGTFLLQLWWSYLLLLVLVPIALLALDGLDHLMSHRGPRFRTAVAGIILASVPAVLVLGLKTMDLAQNGFGLAGNESTYKESVSSNYREINEDVVHLATGGSSPICILGDPLYLYLSDRPQAPAINGWSPEFWTDALWQEFGDGLAAEQPEYLFVSGYGNDLALERSPQTLRLIEAEYEVLRQSRRDGIWYVHRRASTP